MSTIYDKETETFARETQILPTRLRESRERAGFYQTTVSKHLGIHSSALSNYERGLRAPNTVTLASLAKMYNVSTDYLLGLTDTMISTTPSRRSVVTATRWYNDSVEKRTNDLSELAKSIETVIKMKKNQ